MSLAVFADTFYWIALASSDDASHARAVTFDLSPERPSIMTSEEILSEFLTFFGGKGPFLRAKAVLIVRRILADKNIVVMSQTHDSFSAGLELFAGRLDKAYSLTGCIAMAIMRRERLSDVLTDDRHFEQEGFRALLRV